MPSIPPPEALAAANEVAGKTLQVVRPFTHRRGTSVFKLRDDGDGRYALKVAKDEDDDTPYSPSACLRREAIFLRELPEFCNEAFIGEGKLNEGYWVLKNWVDGTLVHRKALDIRRDFTGKECEVELAKLFVLLLETFAGLHEKGYLHGDVQPNHLLMTNDNKLFILDWALGRTIKEKTPAYQGAFLHYAAPEVAQGMREENKDIPYGIKQEIFSVGATIFCLYTDWTVTGLAPRAEHPGKEALFSQLIDKGAITISDTDAPPFPALQEMLLRCLDKSPEKRWSTLEEAAKALKALIPA